MNKYLLFMLGAILLARFIPMVMVPFSDPTEARYAEIARIMMETGDWITPYYDYGVPFWGKPPLAFWAQAISFHIFGVNEFAPRFPSWLVTIALVYLIFHLLNTVASQRAAITAGMIFTSCLLVFALSGAVLTDPFLTLAVTLSLVAFALVRHQKQKYWRYWFFVGLALGMLSKGPIAIVLIAGPIGIWLILGKHRWRELKLFPWLSGTLLALVLTLPWYIAAEIKTPGFIQYFIVGEHFYRFIDPGWAGDLYGSAHKHPKGTIWIQWLVATLPWGIVALAGVLKGLRHRESRHAMREYLKNDDNSFYVLWAIFTMCFFSLAGNVLWTYTLPALPALAILLAMYFDKIQTATESDYSRWLSLGALISPVFLVAATLYVIQHPELLPTEKYLVDRYNSQATSEDTLLFIDDRSFSARYYSQGKAVLLTIDDLKEKLLSIPDKHLYLAIPHKDVKTIQELVSRPMSSLFKSNKYELFKVQDNTASINDSSAGEATSP